MIQLSDTATIRTESGGGTIFCDGAPGASITVEVRPVGGATWHTLNDVSGSAVTFSAAGYANFEIGSPVELQLSAASAAPIVLSEKQTRTKPE